MAFDNMICPVCGHRMMVAVDCPQLGAVIHMEHCYTGCEYFIPEFSHCRYRLHKMNSRRREAEENRLKQKIAACKGRLETK